MASFRRFGFFLLLLQIAEVRIQAQVQGTPTADNTEDLLRDIQARLLAMEQKLHKIGKVILSGDVVRVIGQGNLKLAEQKMLEIDDPETISEIVHDVNADSGFGDLIDLAKSLTDRTLKFQILTHLCDEVAQNNNTTTLNMIALAKVLKPEEAEDVEEIDSTSSIDATRLNTLLDQIKVNTIERLADVLQSNESYEHNADVKALSVAIADWRNVSANVMMELVRKSFTTVDHNRILEAVHSHDNTLQALVGVNELFWRMRETGSLKGNIALNLASHLNEIMNRTGYSQVDSRVKSNAERVVDNLPVCVRNLFFQPTFCIWNKKESSVISLVPLDNNRDRSQTFLTASRYEDGTITDGVSWRFKYIEGKLFFESVDYPDQKLDVRRSAYTGILSVLGNVPVNKMDNRGAWTLEVDGDYCYLRNVVFDLYISTIEIVLHMVHLIRENEEEGDSEVDISASSWQIRNC